LKITREIKGNEVIADCGVLRVVNNIRYEDIVFPKLSIGRFLSSINPEKSRVSFDAVHPERLIEFYMYEFQGHDLLYYLTYRYSSDGHFVGYYSDDYQIITYNLGFPSGG
jgi:hypothetical protein